MSSVAKRETSSWRSVTLPSSSRDEVGHGSTSGSLYNNTSKSSDLNVTQKDGVYSMDVEQARTLQNSRQERQNRLSTRIQHVERPHQVEPRFSAADQVLKINNMHPSQKKSLQGSTGEQSLQDTAAGNLIPLARADDEDEDSSLTSTSVSYQMRSSRNVPEISPYCLSVLSDQPQVRSISSKHEQLALEGVRRLQKQQQVADRKLQYQMAAHNAATSKLEEKKEQDKERLVKAVVNFSKKKLDATAHREQLNALRENKLRQQLLYDRLRSDDLKKQSMLKEERVDGRLEKLRKDRVEEGKRHGDHVRQRQEEVSDRRMTMDLGNNVYRENQEHTQQDKQQKGHERAMIKREMRKKQFEAQDEVNMTRVLTNELNFKQQSEQMLAALVTKQQAAEGRIEATREERRRRMEQCALERMHRQEQITSGMLAQTMGRTKQEQAIAAKYVDADSRILTARQAKQEQAWESRLAQQERRQQVLQNRQQLDLLEGEYLRSVHIRQKEEEGRGRLVQAENEQYQEQRKAQLHVQLRNRAISPRKQRRKPSSEEEYSHTTPVFTVHRQKTVNRTETKKHTNARLIQEYMNALR